MATPFLQQFYQIQQLALELQREIHQLEQMGFQGLNAMSTNTDLEDDPEAGTQNPLLKKIQSISSLIAKIRAMCYECEKLTNHPIERSKLSTIDKQCNDAESTIHRYRNRVNEKRRQLEVDQYLFGAKKGTIYENAKEGEGDSLMGKKNPNGGDRSAYFHQEQDTLQSAMRTMQQSINNAYDSINSLDRQKELFFNIRRKTADLATQLGFSRDVIGWIQRQEFTNTVITFVGMFITVTIILIFYYWWTSGRR